MKNLPPSADDVPPQQGREKNGERRAALAGRPLACVSRLIFAGAAPEENASKEGALEAERARIAKLYRWGDMSEAEYVAERRRLTRELEQLRGRREASAPSDEALTLANTIGTAWSRVSATTRRRFLREWFGEIRLAADGSVLVVPCEPYRELVWASVVGAVGAAGIEPATSRM
jgi:hypothetical protein